MNKNELVIALNMGREIEFSYKEKSYFLTPNYSKQCYYFLEVEDFNGKWKKIFTGEIDEILNFKFEGEHSLRDDIKEFEFNYIL